MSIDLISSLSDLQSRAGKNGKYFLMLFRKGSQQSDCAMQNLLNTAEKARDLKVFAADVSIVRDIHTEYGVTTVPSLLSFNDAKLTGIVKGCQDTDFYRAMTENLIFRSPVEGEATPARRVTVYSTPTCSWCNTLKSWLKQNGINYTDIDVSRDQRAAEDLVKRTGQQGVPQTDINGEIVVGFNQPKLKQLLGI